KRCAKLTLVLDHRTQALQLAQFSLRSWTTKRGQVNIALSYLDSRRIDTRLGELVAQCEQRPLRRKFKSDNATRDIRASAAFMLDVPHRDKVVELTHSRGSRPRHSQFKGHLSLPHPDDWPRANSDHLTVPFFGVVGWTEIAAE